MTRHRAKWFQGRLQGAVLAALCASLSAAAGAAGPSPLADYDVVLEIENTSPQKQTDWPVIMTVYKVFGRNLPADTLNPAGYHVYDEKGREIPHMIEAIPPYDQQGNNEIVFIIPQIERGQKLRYRITNTAEGSARQAKIDVVGSRHNLISNLGFEQKGTAEGQAVAGWELDGRPDAEVKRSGSSSVRLRGARPQRLRHAEKIPLRQGGRYYFGIWGKTHEVSRHGIHTARGGCFELTGFSSGWRGILTDSRGTQLTDWDGNIIKKDLDARTQETLKRSFEASRAAWIFPQC
ncbi:MAG: hypothetical protein AMJ81_10135, partial [Phycisphaerae bacterium SM23_33]